MTDQCRLCVIVPTRDEEANVAELTQRLCAALVCLGNTFEILFVDDSDDATPQVIAGLRASGLPVRCHHRRAGERHGGLGGAVAAGFQLAAAEIIAVIDGDLQHPPEALPALVAPALEGHADLCAGTRYAWAGGDSGLAGWWRRRASGLARVAAHALLPPTRPLQDPMSGFFALRADLLDGAELRPSGFKILVEVAVRARPARVANIGYDFAARRAGCSKAGLYEGLRFARHLGRLVAEH